MKIIELIRSCITPLEGNPALYTGPKWLQNVKADNVAFPCVFMDQPLDWTFYRASKYAQIQEIYSPTILFCDKSEPEYTQEQHNVIIDYQRTQAYQFITNLMAHPDIYELMGEPQLNDVFNFLDQNLTGVALQFKVKLKSDEAICPQEPIYLSNPTLTSITPTSALQGDSLTISLFGSDLLEGASISINGELIEINSIFYVSYTQIDISITINSLALIGTRSITIENPDGIKATLPNCLTILPN